MIGSRRKLLGFSLAVALLAGSASADAIAPGGVRPSGERFAASVVAGAPTAHGGLAAPDESMLGPDWRAPFPTSSLDLLAAALGNVRGARVGGDSSPPVLSGRLHLWAGTEGLTPSRLDHDPEFASDSGSDKNVRVPEPASLTLLLAGVVGIGLALRMRLRGEHRPVPARAASAL